VENRTSQFIGRSDTSNSFHEYFSGDLDDLRIYRVNLSASEIGSVYAETNSSLVYTIEGLNNPTSFSATGLPTGLSLNPSTGEISGHSTSIGDHNVTIIASNLSGSSPSKTLTLTIGASKPIIETNYPVTRESDLLGWFKFDETSGTTASNYGTKGSAALLAGGATFSTSEKKFGSSSLNIPTGNMGAYAQVTNPIDLSGNPFTLSVWFKKLYGTGAFRTLTRDNSSNYHHVIINNGTDNLGTWGWVDSGYDLPTSTSASSWNHLVVSFDGTTGKFYHEGNFVGSVNADRSSNIYSIGNYQGGGQRFAEYLDDFRVYGVALTANEAAAVYGEGNGDLFAVNSGSTSATATVTLKETGGANVSMDIFYGSVDKGATTAGWDANTSLSGIKVRDKLLLE
jgi:hypothetical protein